MQLFNTMFVKNSNYFNGAIPQCILHSYVIECSSEHNNLFLDNLNYHFKEHL